MKGKKILPVAVAAAMTSIGAGVAQAQTPNLVAEQDSSTIAPLALTGAAFQDIAFGYPLNMSPGEIRSGRFACDSNVNVNIASTIALTDGTGTATIGALNLSDSTDSAFFFSITAGADLTDTPTTGWTLTVTGTQSITQTQSADCTFAIYDQPSQANAGGTEGLITTAAPADFFNIQSAFMPTVTPDEQTADVEAPNVAFSQFLTGGGGNTLNGDIGVADLALSMPTGGLFLADGTSGGAIFDTMFPDADTGFVVTVEGDFVAVNEGATSWTNVNGDLCPTPLAFTGGDTATLTCVGTGSGGAPLLGPGNAFNFVADGVTPMPTSDYDVSIAYTCEVGFTCTDVPSTDLGDIVRNGTVLQASLGQVPGGFISRTVLTNRNVNEDRAFTINVFPAEGTTLTVDPSLAEGTIPAGQSVEIDNNDLVDITSGPARYFLEAIIAAPNDEIQGIQQVTNTSTFGVDSTQMVRDGEQ